jgi:hypothetical protein
MLGDPRRTFDRDPREPYTNHEPSEPSTDLACASLLDFEEQG